jgi:hypothetical protein
VSPGDDVLVDLAGDDEWWPGEVLKVETSGFVLCRVHVDPAWDFGGSSSRVMPEQTVAVRRNYVRPRQ